MRKSFKRRPKKEEAELDITSLLDILVILLVFLLKSYSASELKLDLISGLEPAKSKSRVLGHLAPTIQVNSDSEIFLDHRKVASTSTRSEKIDDLFDELMIKAEKNATQGEAADKEGKMINLVFDQNTEYQFVQKVMHTSALAGYTKFKLIVKGNY